MFPPEDLAPANFTATLEEIKNLPLKTEAETRAYEFQSHVAPLMRASGFDDRFLVDGFPSAGGGPKTNAQLEVFYAVLERLKNEGAIIALCGPRGIGKTTIAAQIATQRIWEDWVSVFDKRDGKRNDVLYRPTLYWKMTGLIKRLKPIYGDWGTTDTVTIEACQRAVIACDLLVLDELQEAGDDGRHKDKILTDVIDRRYAKKRDTILITNQTPEEFRATTNSSVISRLGEHGEIIDCAWQSFRENP